MLMVKFSITDIGGGICMSDRRASRSVALLLSRGSMTIIMLLIAVIIVDVIVGGTKYPCLPLDREQY